MLPIAIAAELLTARRVLRVFRLARYANKVGKIATKLDHELNEREIAAHDASSYELIHEPIHGEDIYIMMHGIAIINVYRSEAGASFSPSETQLAQVISYPFTTPQVKAFAHDPVAKVTTYFEVLFKSLNNAPGMTINMKTLATLRNVVKRGKDVKLQFIANAINPTSNRVLIKATAMAGYNPDDAVFLAKSVTEGTLGLNSKLEQISKEKNFIPLTLVATWIRILEDKYVETASSIKFEGADFTVDMQLRNLPVNYPYERRVIKTPSTRPVLPQDVKRVTEQLADLYLGTPSRTMDEKEEAEENAALKKAEDKAVNALNLISNNKH